MTWLAELIKSVILLLIPNFRAMAAKIIREKKEDDTDKKNAEKVDKDISENANRETRKKDVANLLNGND